MPQYNTTPDLLEMIRVLQNKIEKLERQNVLQNATIDIGDYVAEEDVGLKVIDSSTGITTFWIGGAIGSVARPDGTPQPTIIMRRDDGSTAFAIQDTRPNDATYSQVAAMYDNSGNRIFAEDADSGYGYALPNTHYPLYKDVQNTEYTTSSYVTAYRGVIHTGMPKLNIAILGLAAAGTSGEIRLLLDGVQLGNIQTFNGSEWLYWNNLDLTHINYNSVLNFEVQIRRTAGTATVRCQVGWCYGKGT